MNEIKSYEDLMNKINEEDAHLFLANGFNMALGVDTSYKNIWNKMLKERRWKNNNLFNKLKGKDNFIKSKNYNIEDHLDELITQSSLNKEAKKLKNKRPEALQKGFASVGIKPPREKVKEMSREIKEVAEKDELEIKEKLYKIVWKISGDINFLSVRDMYIFLKDFKSFYTINYDPMLYRLLVRFSLGSSEEDKLESKEKLKKEAERDQEKPSVIFSNSEIKEMKKILDKPPFLKLKSKMKKKIIDYIESRREQKNNKNNESNKKINLEEDFFGMENSDEIMNWERGIKDGFSPSDKKLKWKGEINANLFYLHGGIHIYEEQECFFKLKLKKVNSVLNDSSKKSTCVFFSDQSEKMRAIENSDYLTKGFESFSNIRGNLVIIGWSCKDNDEHLIKVINENENLKKIYISYYSPEGKERIDQKLGVSDKIVPFDIKVISDKLKPQSSNDLEIKNNEKFKKKVTRRKVSSP